MVNKAESVLESEQAIIGSILLEPRCINLLTQLVADGTYFQNNRYGQIYDLMLKLHNDGIPIDLVTVYDHIQDKDMIQLIASATSSVPTATHAEYYARIVRDYHARRMLQRNLKLINPLDTCKYPTPLDIVTDIQKTLETTNNIVQEVHESAFEDMIGDRLDAYFEEESSGGNKRIISTGFIDLDNIATGLENGENIILGARPSIGKTALALKISLNVAKRGIKVLFFSLEMTNERLVDRLICINGMIDAERFKRRKLSEDEKRKAIDSVGEIYNIPLQIVDKNRSLLAIKSIIAKHCQEPGGVGLAVIDYLQLVVDRSNNNRSRSNEVGSIAKGIQIIAQDFDIPILVLSQLNRKIEGRENKKPNLGDLYESGDIEAAADKVIFLHREEDNGVVDIGVAKQRDGRVGAVQLAWYPWCTRFDNLARGKT